jgi:acetyltransferase-like isoleucine patch superfamily enzyme
VRKDHRPFWLKKLHRSWLDWRSRHFLEPQFEAVGPHLDVVYPQYIQVHGPNISIGRCATLRSARAYPITLTTWTSSDREGRIDIGDHVLISPGTRILSSDHVRIGSNTMIAGEVYISDSDWHDVYDRTSEQDAHSPITLEENVWLGYGVKICKGVTIGQNSVVGSGAVVAKSLPANVIAVGNPARVVRALDPETPIRLREQLYADPTALRAEMDKLESYFLRGNSLLGWLRALVAPSRRD